MGEKPAILAGYVAGGFGGAIAAGLLASLVRADVGGIGMCGMIGGAVGALIGCYVAVRLIRRTDWSDPDYDDAPEDRPR